MTSTRSFWSIPQTQVSRTRLIKSPSLRCRHLKSAHRMRATRASAMEKSSTARNTNMTLTPIRGSKLPTSNTCWIIPIWKEIVGTTACWLIVCLRSSTRATTRRMTPLTLSLLKELRSSASVKNLSEKNPSEIKFGIM